MDHGFSDDRAHLASLRRLRNTLMARVRIGLDAVRIRIGDLETLAAHARQSAARKTANLTRSQRLHAHGRRMEILGALDLDDYAILGLEAHSIVHALWVARAAAELPACDYARVLRHILSDPNRAAWCRAEGARVSWEHAKTARETETREFKERDARGTLSDWRPRPVTERQTYLITLICVRASIPMPTGLRRGSAYDWIQIKGCHPDFWSPPAAAPEWPA